MFKLQHNSHISHASNVMLKILQASFQQYVNHELRDQAGFRKGRGTRDQTANICWIIEKAREFQKKYLLLLYWIHQRIWLCGSQQTVENSARDGNTRPPYLSIGSPWWTQVVKHLPAMRETRVRSLGQEDSLEKEMATHSSILAWKIPWMEEPGGLQSMRSQKVGHDWMTSLFLPVEKIVCRSRSNS